MIYHYILSSLNNINSRIQSIEQKLKSYPAGSIYCTRDGNRKKWFYTKDNMEIYLPKTERHLAEELAQKKYLSLLLKDYLQEKKALEFYLRHHNNSNGQAALNLLSKPEYHELITPIFKSLSQEMYDWMNESYPSNPACPEHLIHPATNGKKVRSKSEAIIDLLLSSNNIPFRYEAPLIIFNRTYYPDFTIRHPVTGELYYWEHLGLIDVPEYAAKNIEKLKAYMNHGIFPGDKLIITCETKDNPLSIAQVTKTIQYYFF